MNDIKRILVVSRSTKYCRKAVHCGISLAKRYRAGLYVLHVIHNPFGLEGLSLLIPSLRTLEEDYERIQEQAKSALDEIINLEKGRGMMIEVFVRRGDPKEEILTVIEENKIDLLIMLAHEEWRLEHFLFSGATEAIIRRMPCSIMLVKQELSSMAN